MRLRVLFIDDDANVAAVLKDRLKDDVELIVADVNQDPLTEAEYLARALDAVSQSRPDVILLDVMFPIAGPRRRHEPVGLTILSKLKGDGSAVSSVPVVLYTSHESGLASIESVAIAKLAEQSLSKPAGDYEWHFEYLRQVLRVAS